MNASAIEIATQPQAAPLTQGDCVATTNAQRHAERMQAHADFLTARQRASGMRVRLCSTGCYSMYDADGHFIGRTAPPGALLSDDSADLRETALRMAMSGELATACRLADLDWSARGCVSSDTMLSIRAALAVVGVAS